MKWTVQHAVAVVMISFLLACGLGFSGFSGDTADAGVEAVVTDAEATLSSRDGAELDVRSGPVESGEDGSLRGAMDAGKAFSAYAAAVVQDGPVGYWRLDEADGDLAHDEMGAHDGTVSGHVTWRSAGAFGSSNTGVSLDGGCIVVEGFAGLEGALSVEFWITWGALDRILVSEALSPFSGWRIRLDGASPAHVVFESGPASNVTGFGFPLVLAKTFTHVAVMSDGTNAVAYFDGVYAGSGSVHVAPDNGKRLVIGCDSRGNFQGSLDEIAVYDHALSATRVQAHFNASKL